MIASIMEFFLKWKRSSWNVDQIRQFVKWFIVPLKNSIQCYRVQHAMASLLLVEAAEEKARFKLYCREKNFGSNSRNFWTMQKDNRDENSVKVNYRFVLWKENTDTADALFHLARAAKCKGSFQNFYARQIFGTKLWNLQKTKLFSKLERKIREE